MNGDSNDALPIVMIVGATLGLLILMWPRKPKAKPARPPRDRMSREQWKALGVTTAGVVAVLGAIAWAQNAAQPNCDELRAAIQTAKGNRAAADIANAQAEDALQPPVFSDLEVAALRQEVQNAAAEAREHDCAVSDLVGPSVGR